MPTFGTVCDGIGCGHLGFVQAGFACAWSFEIEPFPSAVLAYRFHEVKGSYRFHSHGRARLAFDQAAVEFPGITWFWATLTSKGWERRKS